MPPTSTSVLTNPSSAPGHELMNHPLVALDIGSTKVACAVGLPHERSAGFELLGCSVVAYPVLSDTWLSDPLMVGQAIEQALEATAVTEDVHRAFVTSTHPALASEQIRAAVALGDEPITIRTQDLERLQSAALHQALAVDRDALVVERIGCTGNGFDGVRNPRGLSATRLFGAFHIVTIPAAARRALVQAVESAGLEVARLNYSLPAILASLGDERIGHQRLLLVDIGGVTTDVGLFIEGVLHRVEVVPTGGLRLAVSLAKDLQITMEQALTWSLEGTASRKPEVQTLLEEQWGAVRGAIDRVVEDQPRPDAVLVSGRGALIDGFAEWVEEATGIPTSLCRSPKTNRMSDLSRQMALAPVIGSLELLTHGRDGFKDRPTHLVNRLLDRTRTLLTEYF